MKAHKLAAATFIILLQGGLGIFQLEAQSNEILTGERVWFQKHQPSWALSGVWGPSDTLWLADVLEGKLESYTANGVYQGPIVPLRRKLTRPMIVQTVPSRPGQVWVEDENAQFLLLGSRRQVLDVVSLEERAKGGPEGDLVAIFQWIPLNARELFVFGDIIRGGHGTSAFLRVQLDQPEKFQVIAKVGLNDSGRRFYLLGMPYVASVNGVPYYLVMGEEPYVTSPGRAEKLTITLGQSKQVIKRPQLPEEIGRRASREVFQTLEESTFPAGIFGWRGSLYALVRTPAPQGRSRTSWSLLKLNPETGKTLWQRPIDSTANHLTVVPGEKYWAFIEKGRVEEAGVQEISTFLRVPAKQLDR